MKRYFRTLIIVLLVVEFCFVFLSIKSYTNKNIEKLQGVNQIDKNVFAMYIENDSGGYDEYTDSNYWPNGYKLNENMTMCIDNKGNSITINNLTFENNKMTVQSNKTIFCYLYFDIDKSVYAKVRSDYKNSNGALLLSETESDEYPVYYYSGDITNNNILYANFCWKMVRTTETGGVKLIYNGVPDTAEDGTLTCDNTGEESQIGTSAFNSSSNSLAYVGYMYNTVYKYSSKVTTASLCLMDAPVAYGNYYYGDTATWNSETNQYELSNSDGSEVTTYVWSDDYSNLIGYYTCRSTTKQNCNSVYYIANKINSYQAGYYLSSGNDYDDYKIKLATSIIDNGDGTYTLVEPIEVIKAEYAKNYNNYKGYYYCEDWISDTCEVMYYGVSTKTVYSQFYVIGLNIANEYKYGNSFKYENGIYKLVNSDTSSIKQFWDWPNNYNTLNSNRYTCFNTSGECENIYYMYYFNADTIGYITLSGGNSIEDAINEMLYAEDVNKIDSTIKDYIDTWYENNIIDVLDMNNVLYSTYLENTIWCSSREISNFAGWNPNGGGGYMSFIKPLKCSNKTDQFTLKVEAGGTEGYGNNALDYPIGLLTYKETSLASDNGYINSGNNYWLLSTSHAYLYEVRNVYANANGTNIESVGKNLGVRPAISLSNKVEITSGDGSVSLPYQVTLSS